MEHVGLTLADDALLQIVFGAAGDLDSLQGVLQGPVLLGEPQMQRSQLVLQSLSLHTHTHREFLRVPLSDHPRR